VQAAEGKLSSRAAQKKAMISVTHRDHRRPQ
jgi:hypothetical protein